MEDSNYRYERKYRVTELSYSELLNIIYCSPFLFREIYSQRTVNNIYLDNFDLINYFDNVDGYSKRRKTRIRWYDYDHEKINYPQLEFKIKQGHVGFKKIYPLKAFIFKKGFSRDNLMEVFKNSNLPNEIKEVLFHLRLSLYNKYQRRYFVSSDNHFRITLDKNLEYFELKDCANYFLAKRSDVGVSILELKYNSNYSSEASKIIDKFAFRMTKNSKYVSGISSFLNSID